VKNWKLMTVTTCLVLTLILGSIVGTDASFSDSETSTSNGFTAWVSTLWRQTTQTDFNAGVLSNVDTSSNPGDVKLAVRSDWYNAGWGFRKRITIDHTKVNADSTDFPFLLSLTSDADLASTAQSNGNDILFTAANGTTKLDDEIEQYVTGTGQLVAWVRVPSLSSVIDTVIYLYYGNSSCGNQQNSSGVWNSGYKAVWHMDETSGTTIIDSTSNGNTGTPNGGVTLNATGKIVGGEGFDGIDDWTNPGTSSSLNFGANASFTIEGWVKTTESYGPIISFRSSTDGGPVIDIHVGYDGGTTDAGKLMALVRQDGGSSSYARITGPAVNDGNWHYFVLTRNAGNTIELFSDGVSQGTASGGESGGAITTNIRAFASERRWVQDSYGTADQIWLVGTLDEIRISNTQRSSSWVSACYNNQNSPATFYALAAKEGPYITEVTSWYNTSWTRRCPTIITNSTVAALSGYQVKVAVAFDSDMKPNFDDIRFVDSDGLTLLNYWRESFTASTSATFWVKIPSVPSGTKTIFMYYGNPSASSASDGANTLEFFDEGDQISSWTTGNVGSGSAGQSLTIGNPAPSYYVNSSDVSNYAYMKRDIGLTTNEIIEFDMQTDTSLGQYYVLDVAFLANSTGYGQNFRLEGRVGEKSGFASKDNWTAPNWGVPASGLSYSTGVWHKAQIAIGPTQANGWIDGSLQSSSPYTLRPTAGNTFFGIEWSGRIDNIRVRKYVSPEPTTAVGSEEGMNVTANTIASQVCDTGVVGARWDALCWDKTLQSGTNITLEVRSSDTLFAKDASSPSWVSVGGTSPIILGLPSGRYKQWRATLTTTDSSKTPTLIEVRIYYH
jgi:predicted ribosomally synthesized peptide with SipW-like signal peptide